LNEFSLIITKKGTKHGADAQKLLLIM